MTLAQLSDEELLGSLNTVCFETRRLLGRLLLHLIEVEVRRLNLRSACSSMFDFCVRRLGMSESEAFRRIDAARVVKRFPCLLDALERADISLTTMLLLRDHFTTDNLDELVQAAKGKTKREVQELIAARAPKPDVLPIITALPPPSGTSPPPTREKPVERARLESLSASRHRIELTVNSSVRAKLERARNLLLAKLEKERPGDGIPQDVRRAVFDRDGEQCSFVDEEGNRCESRTRLELDHITPCARSGSDEASNLRVVCRAHNRLYAEQAFGREHVEQQIHLRQRRRDNGAWDVATSALVNLGFRKREVRCALSRLIQPDAAVPAMPDLIR